MNNTQQTCFAQTLPKGSVYSQLALLNSRVLENHLVNVLLRQRYRRLFGRNGKVFFLCRNLGRLLRHVPVGFVLRRFRIERRELFVADVNKVAEIKRKQTVIHQIVDRIILIDADAFAVNLCFDTVIYKVDVGLNLMQLVLGCRVGDINLGQIGIIGSVTVVLFFAEFINQLLCFFE